ncbi:MAG TPA: SET domain-containing protein-lysine N-methyltransferase [Steroidobacteraceae bacterium]
MAPPYKPPVIATSPLIEVRRSKVHGLGVFAKKRIRKGTRIIEYLGDRISHEEADRRYEDHDENDNHTFLFIVDKRTVIDAGVNGNDARFINHGCDPNCESEIIDRRVFIRAIRTIEPGEELNYDYQIGREPDDPPNVDEIYACRCGSPKCRGTMLWPPKRKKTVKKKAVRRASGKAGKSAKKKKKARRR